FHTRKLHDDVVALRRDVRLGHAECVDALANDRRGLIEKVVLDVALLRGEHDRRATLKVKPELGVPALDQHEGQGAKGNDQNSNERDDQWAAAHGWLRRVLVCRDRGVVFVVYGRLVVSFVAGNVAVYPLDSHPQESDW